MVLSREVFGSVRHEGLPVSFPVLPQASWSAPVLGGVPLPQGVSGLPWALVGRPVPWHMQCTLMPCDCLCCKSHRGCFHSNVSFPQVSTYCLACGSCCWHSCFVALHLGSSFFAEVSLSVCCLFPWLASACPVFPSRGCQSIVWPPA